MTLKKCSTYIYYVIEAQNKQLACVCFVVLFVCLPQEHYMHRLVEKHGITSVSKDSLVVFAYFYKK